MEDVSDKGSECEEMMSCKNSPERGGSVSSDGGGDLIKTCADCGTTKTPLWRGGPLGPKSLCNACGIRSRKKRSSSPKDDKKPKKTATASGGYSQASDYKSNMCLKKRLMALGSEVVLQRPRSRVTKKKRRMVGEEEQAAILLMALGSEVVLQRPRSRVTKKKRRMVGEEEQAAILLMALSCGSVFA